MFLNKCSNTFVKEIRNKHLTLIVFTLILISSLYVLFYQKKSLTGVRKM